MDLGSRIGEARRVKGLIQRELSEKIGVASITIQQYEGNKRNPSVEMLGKIAALGCSIGYLYGETDNQHEPTYDDLDNHTRKGTQLKIMSLEDENKVLASFPSMHEVKDANGVVYTEENPEALKAYQTAIVQRTIIKELDIDSECKDKLL